MRIDRIICLLIGVLLTVSEPLTAGEPLMDWSAWKKYRKTVKHPTGYINAHDLKNARENIKRYEWAKKYAKQVEARVVPHLDRFTPEFLEKMVPATSVQRCGPCPACRDKGLSTYPNGRWTWSLRDPDHIKCKSCKTVFPNKKYPETVLLKCKSKWGKGQTISYYGGKTFKQFGYKYYRPSFSGMVRKFKVGWSRDIAYSFALAYALTEKPEYAEVTRKILLRFSEVYPNYLLISDYGEVADMNPHVAGLALNRLPEDELVHPPNKPDRKIYGSYWQTSRIGTGGGDGSCFTRWVLQAYELTYNARKADGTPLYTEQERIKIERDVILESCVHLIGNKSINNKSVANRAAVGVVGMALGHPGLTRFGLEGWDLTMKKMFIADGCTWESPEYALMSLRGIYTFPQAVRGYSDPPGYTDKNGKRIESLNLYDGQYKLVWQRMFEGIQGNLYYPPYADSYPTTRLYTYLAELMAANYPDNLQYLALLKELDELGGDIHKRNIETALLFRRPGLEKEESPPLHFDDNFFPIKCLGQLRTGQHGRKSMALLSATYNGGHYQWDSLNLYYWKDGHELLTDFGYLWDHPMYRMVGRTFAHNTGMVDLKRQKRKGRGGRFILFHTGRRVKVMEASSSPYDNADVFDRTVVQIDDGEDNSYLVDFFRLRADGSRDLVYHGPNNNYKVSDIKLADCPTVPAGMDLKKIKSAPSPAAWGATWKMADDMQFSAYHCGQKGEVVYIGAGWGQRNSGDRDRGVTVPYIVRRHRPKAKAGISTFCTVYEAHKPCTSLVKSVSRLAVPGKYADNIVVLKIETKVGTDLVISQLSPATVEIDTPLGKVRTDARVTVISVRDGKATAALAEGKMLTLNGVNLAVERLKANKALAEQATPKGL